MSPYGFMYGMTNCFFMIWQLQESGCAFYRFGFNDICLMNECFCQFGACMFQRQFRLNIPVDNLAPNSDEFPVKYVAWNPFDSYVYMAVRSSNPDECGIFRIDPCFGC